jgi:hypothetical protein
MRMVVSSVMAADNWAAAFAQLHPAVLASRQDRSHDRVAWLSENLVEAHSDRYAGSADYSFVWHCSMTCGGQPKTSRRIRGKRQAELQN